MTVEDKQIENMDRLSKLMQLKMMEKAMQEVGPIINVNGKQEEDYFQVNARIGTNQYNINVKTVHDYNIAYKLLDVYLGIMQK